MSTHAPLPQFLHWLCAAFYIFVVLIFNGIFNRIPAVNRVWKVELTEYREGSSECPVRVTIRLVLVF